MTEALDRMGRAILTNLDESDLSRAIVNGISDDAPAPAQQFMRESELRDVRFVFGRRRFDNDGQLFIPESVTGWQLIVGAGILGLRPTGGTFTLTDPDAGQTTAAIPYSATAGQLEAAIQIALTTNWSAATVSGEPGALTVTNGVNGARSALAATSTSLLPSGSTVIVTRTLAGSATLPAQNFIETARALPIGRSSGWTEITKIATAITTEQLGDASHNKVFRLKWDPDCYAGDVSLRFLGNAATEQIGPVPFDASADEVKEAFEAHSEVGIDGVSVVKIGPGDYYITCVADAIDLVNTPTLTSPSDTLKVLPGFQGSLLVDTAGVAATLGTSSSAPITFEIRINKGDGWEVVAQVEAMLYANLIRSVQGVSTAIDPTLTRSQQPVGCCWIRHTDGTVTSYMPTADTAAARGARLEEARDAAVSGETIFVAPGSFEITASLAKNGVNWHFAPGSIIPLADGQSLLADSVGITTRIYGHLTLTHSLTGVGQQIAAVVCGHANTDFYLELHDVELESPGDLTRLLTGTAGRVTLRANRVVTQDIVFHSTGCKQVVDCDYARSAGNVVGLLDDDAGMQILRIKEAVSDTAIAFYTSFSGFSGEQHVTVEKVIHNDSAFYGAGGLQTFRCGSSYGPTATSNDVEGRQRGWFGEVFATSAFSPAFNFDSGDSCITVERVQCVKLIGGGTASFGDQRLTINGVAECSVDGYAMDSTYPSFTVSGVVRCTHPNGIPLLIGASGTPRLRGAVLIAGSSATKTVDAATAKNLVATGSYGDKALDANVTLVITGGFVVDADLTA